MSDKFIVSESNQGSGRAVVILHFQLSLFTATAESLYNSLSKNNQSNLISIKQFSNNWSEALNELILFLEQKNIRNASFIGFEDCTVLLQALVLKRPKIVRSLILIDPATRAKPTKLESWIRKVEHILPLGLPFRSDFEGFDAEPFLQRIRCPLLLILATKEDQYKREQLEMISQRAPTSFFIEMDSSESQLFNDSLLTNIVQFSEIPVKSPQKNIGK